MSDFEQPEASTLPHDQATVTRIDPVTSTDHKPGSALESREDAEANEALRAEVADRVDAAPAPGPRDVDAGSPTANFLTRSNIVADGPGTVADFIVVEAPSLLDEDRRVPSDLSADEKAAALVELQDSAAEKAAALPE